MYGSVRSELTRQKSQNSTSTGRPRCLSIRSIATLIQVRSRGNGGAGIVWGWARTVGEGSIAAGSETHLRRAADGAACDLAREGRRAARALRANWTLLRRRRA